MIKQRVADVIGNLFCKWACLYWPPSVHAPFLHRCGKEKEEKLDDNTMS